MLIRLMFEPHKNVKCNVDEMFQCYGENYLSDYPKFEWGGYISIDAKKSLYGNSEPLYQFLTHDGTDEDLSNLKEYVKINPMHGYHTHIAISKNGENEEILN